MNKAQKIVVMVGLAAVVVAALFPPWRLSIDVENADGISAVNGFLGCHFLFAEKADIIKSVGTRDIVSTTLWVLVALGHTAKRESQAMAMASRFSTLSIDVPRLCLELLAVAAATALLTILVGMLTKRRA